MYQAGPRAAGFDTEKWTTARFADAIFTRFGVRYDPDHAGRIMHRLGLREKARHARRTQEATPFPQNPMENLPRAGVA
jgi:transposase